MTTLTAYDHKGSQIQLISTDKGGGEGAIYRIQERPDEYAKIYHLHKITKELHQKIIAMVNNPPSDPTWSTQKHRSIAWPSAVLYKDKNQTQFIGFTMPFISTKIFKESHKYYDPPDRLKEFFGGFTWRHLFTAAYNIMSSIAALHEKGHCIGDLRETNILVAPNALTTLIDCDSFQIKDRGTGRVFYTRVGTGEYLPPELMGVDFKKGDYDRYYSDLFALGILIFKFLMSGFHPYQAKGPLVDDAPSTEEKIKKGYFAYSGKYKGVKPPDSAPPYDIIPPSIQELFDKCFIEGHKEPPKRPAAKEWFDALRTEGIKLKKCASNENHWYSNHLSYCPWCRIAERTEDIFPSPIGQQISLEDPTQSLDALDKRISYLLSYINMALSDGILSLDEKEYIFNIGSKLQIPKKEIEKVLDAEIQKLKIKPITPSIGTPQIEISKTHFEFLNMRSGVSVSDSFTISNIGGGTLSGLIKTSKKWLDVSESNIDTTRHRQDINFYIDTSGLPFALKDTGIIEIQSNGGTKRVMVDLQIEIPGDALSRFYWEVLPALIIIFGSIGLLSRGLIVYANFLAVPYLMYQIAKKLCS
jgi:serine/threonine protein kinase